MQFAPPTKNESSRLERLHQLGLLDSGPEPAMDTFTQIASAATGMPIALISLVDDKRQWWKSAVGLPQGGSTPRDLAFCAHAIAGDGVLEVENANLDPRFCDNPLVVGQPNVVHYAGAPLVMPGGEQVGTLCVIDHQPGRLDDHSRQMLVELANGAVQVMLMRERERELGARLHAEALVQRELEAEGRRKDEFLAMLAHELRNPLAPIASAAELLRLAGEEPEIVRQSSALIVRQVKHLTGLVDDLLDVSRVTRGLVRIAQDAVALQDVVRGAVEQSSALMQSGQHTCKVEVPADPVWVRGDQLRLVQVLANLLNNAAKFTPAGGQIVLSLHAQAEHATVSVQDNGNGIEASLLPHVFGLFTQAERSLDRSLGGLGLGLALVKSLVELHDGQVWAESEGSGRGTRVWFTLPRIEAPQRVEPDRSAAEERDAETSTPAALRVVVVDDNADAGWMLGNWLERSGHSVTVLTEAEQALARAEEPVDVYVLDIGLPNMDGHALAERLRQTPHGRRATMIAVTGYGQPSDRERSRAAGFDAHLVKPVDLDELNALIDRSPSTTGDLVSPQ